jgi:DNA-binding transcriptional regulator YiaG
MEWTPKAIRVLREFLKEDQAKFAKRCGASRQATVSDWEGGRRKPDGITSRLFDYIAAEAGLDAHRIDMLTRGEKASET